MYKRIGKFLTRIRTKVADFSNFIRIGRYTQSGLAEKRSGPSLWLGRFVREAPDETSTLSPSSIEEDRLPKIPFEMEHRVALWIGESNHEGFAFVLETKTLILEMAGVNQLTCSEIARQLNRISSTSPCSGEWSDALVYHFTRHYMTVRPAFYSESRWSIGES